MATLASRIKELRISKNLTQEEFGQLFGIVKSTVSLYESSKSNPDDELKKKIASYFGVSLDYLMGETDDSTRYRDINADIDAERDFDAELKELLKDEDLVAFHDFAKMDNESKKEIIQFIKFKKTQKENLNKDV